MTETRSNRDRWLAATLPAWLVLLVGWALVIRPQLQEVDSLRKRVENQGTPAALRDQANRLRAEATEREAAVAERRKALEAATRTFGQNAAMGEISALCEAQGLSLDASTAEISTSRLPAVLQSAATSFAGLPGATIPQTWRLELRGSYSGVLKLLDGLGKAKPLVVPLSLSMVSDKNERRPASWVLILWL